MAKDPADCYYSFGGGYKPAAGSGVDGGVAAEAAPKYSPPVMTALPGDGPGADKVATTYIKDSVGDVPPYNPFNGERVTPYSEQPGAGVEIAPSKSYYPTLEPPGGPSGHVVSDCIVNKTPSAS